MRTSAVFSKILIYSLFCWGLSGGFRRLNFDDEYRGAEDCMGNTIDIV